MLWHQLSERVLQGKQITRDEALQVLSVPEEELLEMISACYRCAAITTAKRSN